MSNKSKRRPSVPPRPKLFNEQQRAEIRKQAGDIPMVLNQQQCIEFAVGLAANLETLLNNHEKLPWITASIDKRSDGFSLHVQVVQPSVDVDAVVLGGEDAR
jgi:hypothetical protein